MQRVWQQVLVPEGCLQSEQALEFSEEYCGEVVLPMCRLIQEGL
jgi:hypothetical protein